MGFSLPGSPVHRIFKARILEWVAISSFRGSSPLRDISCISESPALAGGFFTTEPLGKYIYSFNTMLEKEDHLFPKSRHGFNPQSSPSCSYSAAAPFLQSPGELHGSEIFLTLRTASIIFQEKCPPNQTWIHLHLRELISIFSFLPIFWNVKWPTSLRAMAAEQQCSADELFNIMELFTERNSHSYRYFVQC